MLAMRLSSLSSAKRALCRGSCANSLTTRTPDSVSCRYAVICATFSRVTRYASAGMMRKTNDATPRAGEREECRRGGLGARDERDHRRADQRQRGAEQRHDAVRDQLVERLDVV